MEGPRTRNVAVLLAGGVGVRVGLDVPKQLIEVGGRTILEHSLLALHSHPMVDEVKVLMAAGYVDAARAIVDEGGYDKVTAVVEGGSSRTGSTVRAIGLLGDEECHVLFHDAARPLVTHRVITECLEKLRDYPAAAVAIPSTDTILEVGDDNTVTGVPPRATLQRAQTPQAFRSSVIREAYERAAQDPAFAATDDCSVVLRYLPGHPIWVVRGEQDNLKVTEPIDVYVVDRLLRLRSDGRPEA